jgi:hypothetical protein
MNLPTLEEMCISEKVQDEYAKYVAINDIIEEVYEIIVN